MNHSGYSGILVLLFLLMAVTAGLIVQWRIFRKAGYAGWISLIPVLNSYTFYELCGMSGLWVVLNVGSAILMNLLPLSLGVAGLLLIANMLVVVCQGYRLGRVFGKGTGFCLFSALLMPLAMLVLAFDNSRWLGDSSAEVGQ